MASEVELLEVFRLGEAAGEADIVREVGDRLAAELDAGVAVPGGAGAHVPVIAGAVQPEHAAVGWSGAGRDGEPDGRARLLPAGAAHLPGGRGPGR